MYLSCSCLPCLVPMNYGVAMRPYTHGVLREPTRAQSDAVAGAGQAFTKVMMQECCRPDCAVRYFERRLDPLVGLQMRASEIVEIIFSCSASLPSCWQVDVGIARLPVDGSPVCDVVGVQRAFGVQDYVWASPGSCQTQSPSFSVIIQKISTRAFAGLMYCIVV